jgi:hypothetical protein
MYPFLSAVPNCFWNSNKVLKVMMHTLQYIFVLIFHKHAELFSGTLLDRSIYVETHNKYCS